MSDQEEFRRQKALIEEQAHERVAQGEREHARFVDQAKDDMCEPVWRALKESGKLTKKVYF